MAVSRFLILAVSLTVSQGCGAVQSTQVTLIDSQLQMIRVLRYEATLGGELSAQAGLCIDERMANHGLIPPADALALSPRALTQLRRSAEACALSKRGEESADPSDSSSTFRAVGELRVNLVSLREFAEKLRKGRLCIREVVDEGAMRNCVVASTGAQPTPQEWQQWMVLYRTSRS